jgi:hypothetical protein
VVARLFIIKKQLPQEGWPNLGNQIEGSTAPSADSETAEGPVDESLREFLGEDAAIMAGLNPFINDLT